MVVWVSTRQKEAVDNCKRICSKNFNRENRVIFLLKNIAVVAEIQLQFSNTSIRSLVSDVLSHG